MYAKAAVPTSPLKILLVAAGHRKTQISSGHVHQSIDSTRSIQKGATNTDMENLWSDVGCDFEACYGRRTSCLLRRRKRPRHPIPKQKKVSLIRTCYGFRSLLLLIPDSRPAKSAIKYF